MGTPKTDIEIKELINKGKRNVYNKFFVDEKLIEVTFKFCQSIREYLNDVACLYFCEVGTAIIEWGGPQEEHLIILFIYPDGEITYAGRIHEDKFDRVINDFNESELGILTNYLSKITN